MKTGDQGGGGGDMHINGKNKHESHGLVEGTL